MKYVRTFEIAAAHLSDGLAYECLRNKDYESALRATHGHNFIITVQMTGELGETDDWLASDVTIARIVHEWDNANLSVHPDFYQTKHERATTENMARVLLSKLQLRFMSLKILVRIEETRDIYAEEKNW